MTEEPPGQVPAPDARQLARNVFLIQGMSFTWMFMLIMPVVVPFFHSHGLGMHGVYQLQTIFGLTIVLFEVPSGYISDLLGRRGCLIAAGLLHGLAFTWMALATGFWTLAAYQLLAGIAVSLYSGTDVALLFDSLEAQGRHEERTWGLGRRLFWMQIGETVSALFGGWLAVISLQAVANGNAVAGWLPLIVAFFLVDVPRPKMDRRTHRENFTFVRNTLFRSDPFLRLVMFNLIAYGLATLVAVWAFQGLWKELGIPLHLFGLLWASYNLVVALVGGVAHRLVKRFGVAPTLAWIGWLPPLGYVSLALCSGVRPSTTAIAVLAVLGGLLFQVSRGLTQVVIKGQLNATVPTEMRATANSVSSLGVRLSFALLGPLFGWIVDGRGYPLGFWLLAGIFTLTLVFLNRALVRQTAAR